MAVPGEVPSEARSQKALRGPPAPVVLGVLRWRAYS